MARLFIYAIALLISTALCDEHSHIYRAGEKVAIWFNTVGPKDNRQETYAFTLLPFCLGNETLDHYHETIGEAFLGLELLSSGMDIKFAKDTPNTILCETKLDFESILKFQYAAANNYVLQSYVDDLPMWGNVGMNNTIYTHRNYSFQFNGDRIIHATYNPSCPIELSDVFNGQVVNWTYSANWTPTNDTFESRWTEIFHS